MTQEKPWWEDGKYRITRCHEDGVIAFVNIEAIVAEAERRGKLSAWEDAHRLASLDGKDQSWLLAQVNAKIAILEAL